MPGYYEKDDGIQGSFINTKDGLRIHISNHPILEGEASEVRTDNDNGLRRTLGSVGSSTRDTTECN